MPEPILQVRGITKEFPGVQALLSVDLDINAGEIHALVGENGAGKSTLIQILAGVLRPDDGAIFFESRPVRLEEPRQAEALGISIIYQEPHLCLDLTVAENLFLGRLPRTRFGFLDRKRLLSDATQLLNGLKADISPQAYVRGLSAAQRQMISIARALVRSSKVLILDEPTASLTETEVARLFGIVRTLKSQRVGILYISHRLEEIFALSDRVTVLRDGERVATTSTRDITPGDLIRQMVGYTLETTFPRTRPPAHGTALEVEELSRPPLLKDIAFQLRHHEILGVAGLVGSGRSELAQALFGLTPAASGQVFVGGVPVEIDSPQKALAQGIAYVPEDRQQEGLLPGMGVSENLTLSVIKDFTQYGWIKAQKEHFTARFWAERLGVQTPHLEQHVRYLSGGNQQKVLLARGLAVRPNILILDEPTRGVDVWARAQIHQLIDEFAREGMSILLISSDLPEVLGMSDRIIVMRQGRIVAHFGYTDGLPEPTPEKVLQAAFGAG